MVDHKNSKEKMTNNHLVKLYFQKDVKLHKKKFDSYVYKTHKAINYSIYIYIMENLGILSLEEHDVVHLIIP
jgi:hypothetical protein